MKHMEEIPMTLNEARLAAQQKIAEPVNPLLAAWESTPQWAKDAKAADLNSEVQ